MNVKDSRTPDIKLTFENPGLARHFANVLDSSHFSDCTSQTDGTSVLVWAPHETLELILASAKKKFYHLKGTSHYSYSER